MNALAKTASSTRHEVQFFRDDSFLADQVATFIGEGLERHEGAIVIATVPHLLAVNSRLEAQGLKVKAAIAAGQLVLANAEQTLDRFMHEGMPDPERFDRSIGALVRETLAKFGSLRAYGEMVDLLSASGKHAATLALEEAWNRLLDGTTAHLLCGYRLDTFDQDEHREPFRHVCNAHSHVIPTENFTQLDSASQARAIVALEQKARALESEIEHRKRTEAALIRTQNGLHDFFENAPIGFHWVDAKGIIIRANRAELDLLGYSSEEYIGRSITEFHADPENITCMLERLLRGESLSNHPARLRCRDGSIKHVVIDSNGLWENDTFIHTRCSTRDVTKQVEAEEALQRQSVELARSNGELSQFASMASHDLQEPLRMISSYITLLERRMQGSLDDKSKEFMAYIGHGAARLRSMIKAILSYASVGTQLNVEEVQSIAILREALDNLDEKITSTQAVISFDELPRVRADRVLLLLLFQNLIGNAIKFCKGRAPAIRISARVQEKETIFIISDNGIGIKREDQTKLFTLFNRLHLQEEYPGTGIGLATCLKIVERHGGRIWVESTPDVGSMFFVSLPR